MEGQRTPRSLGSLPLYSALSLTDLGLLHPGRKCLRSSQHQTAGSACDWSKFPVLFLFNCLAPALQCCRLQGFGFQLTLAVQPCNLEFSIGLAHFQGASPERRTWVLCQRHQYFLQLPSFAVPSTEPSDSRLLASSLADADSTV